MTVGSIRASLQALPIDSSVSHNPAWQTDIDGTMASGRRVQRDGRGFSCVIVIRPRNRTSEELRTGLRPSSSSHHSCTAPRTFRSKEYCHSRAPPSPEYVTKTHHILRICHRSPSSCPGPWSKSQLAESRTQDGSRKHTTPVGFWPIGTVYMTWGLVKYDQHPSSRTKASRGVLLYERRSRCMDGSLQSPESKHE